MLKLNADDVEGGMNTIARAMRIAPRHAAIINHVANHMFYQGKYDQVIQLAEKALATTEAKQLQAESHFQLGRAYQAKEEYNKAHQHYTQSTTLDPDGILAQYGLGQMQIFKSEPGMAAKCFEIVLSKDADCWEALPLPPAKYPPTHAAHAPLHFPAHPWAHPAR